MSTMSDLHIRTQDELDYLAEVDYYNRASVTETVRAIDAQPLWLLRCRAAVADGLRLLARKIDYCPF